MYEQGTVLSIQYPTFKHYGIYIGDGLIVHNSKKFKQVQTISVEDFKDGRAISVSSIKPKNNALAVQTAKKYLGLPYRLFDENCEHLVRTVCGLTKESTQVQKYLISALGTGALLKSDSTVVKAAGGAATVAALLTSSETSPVKNAAVAACLAMGVAFLVGEEG